MRKKKTNRKRIHKSKLVINNWECVWVGWGFDPLT